MTDIRDAALELAARGVAVFPCNADKTPRTPNGFHDATTDAETVAGWGWGGGMIGAAIPEGTVVVDVDVQHGGDKLVAFLESQGKALPHTRQVRTKSGGSHFYYRVPEGVALRNALGPGVDTRRAGKGYVIVPPSPGYLYVQGGEPSEAPHWLLDELTVPDRPEGAGEASDPKAFPWEDGTAYGMAALERELGRLATAPEGGRNEALNRAAFALAQLVAGGELREGRAKSDLICCAIRIGLETDETHKTLESGWAAGLEEPRQAPPSALDVSDTAGPKTVEGPDAEERLWVDWTEDEEPPPFYLHPLLPKNAYVLVYGSTEASKSMVWLGLLAQGSHRGIRSSFYSLENPPHTDRDRLRRWAPDPSAFRLTNEPLDLNDPRQLGALVAREKAWGTDVVVLDTYSHAFNSRSEDGNAKAIEFARRIRHVMHEVGCSVVLIDHTGYAQEDEPRDASAKRQQVDVGVLMKKAGEWRPGQAARFTMKCTKSARFANPFYLTGEIRDAKDETRGLELGWLGDRPRWEPAT